MKTKTSLIALLCALFLGLGSTAAHAQNETATPGYLYWGYCDYKSPIYSSYGVGFTPDALGTRVLGIWARFSRSQVQAKKGCSVVGVRVAMQRQLNHAKVQLMEKIPGEVLREKTVDLNPGWNEVMFDEPLAIDALSGLYFGYSYDWSSLVSENDSDVAAADGNKNAPGDAFLYNFDGEIPMSAAKTYGAVRLQLIVTGPDESINNYCSVSQLKHDGARSADKTVGVSFVVTNDGANEIKDLEALVVVDGTTVKTEALTTSIAPMQSRRLTVKGINLNEGQELRLQIRKINGYRRIPSPIATITAGKILDKGFKRLVLLEQFSTEECSSCPDGHKEVERILEEEGFAADVAWVIHHDGFTADEYTLPEQKILYNLFGPDDETRSVFAPAISLDRTGSSLGLGNGVYVYPAHKIILYSEDNVSLFSEAAERPAVLTVELSEEMDVQTRDLSLSVSGEVIPEYIDPANLYMNILIVEDDVKADRQAGNKGQEWWHHGLVRKFVTDPYGDQLTVDASNRYTYTTKLNIPEEWSAANLRVVAFVAKKFSQWDSSQVYNTAETRIKAFESVETLPAEQYALYTQNGAICVTGNATVQEVYAMSGARVANQGLAAGIYVARILSANGTAFVKVQVR